MAPFVGTLVVIPCGATMRGVLSHTQAFLMKGGRLAGHILVSESGYFSDTAAARLMSFLQKIAPTSLKSLNRSSEKRGKM